MPRVKTANTGPPNVPPSVVGTANGFIPTSLFTRILWACFDRWITANIFDAVAVAVRKLSHSVSDGVFSEI